MYKTMNNRFKPNIRDTCTISPLRRTSQQPPHRGALIQQTLSSSNRPKVRADYHGRIH